MKYFSKETNGFYDDAVNPQIPDAAVEISDEQYQALIDGQSTGKIIIADENGNPVLTDAPEPSPEDVAAQKDALVAEAMRQEADPLFFQWQAGETTKAVWLAKRQEIKARFSSETA